MTTIDATQPDTAAFLAQCEQLVPGLTAAATEAEDLRRLPSSTLAAIDAADLVRAIVPTELGGAGLGLDALCQGTRILAHGCPASAWTISFLMQHAWLLTKFPKAARDEFFAGGGVPTCAAPLAPTGTIEPVDGSFVVTGRWEFATAVEHADWVMVHGIEVGPALVTRFAVLPLAAVEVDDVWFTSGMRATGSNNVRVDKVFVPAHFTQPGLALFDGDGALEGDGLSNLPLISVLALTASAPAVGAAEAAVDLYRERLRSRVLAYSLGDRAAEQPAAQIRLATAMSRMATTRAGWDAAIARIVDGAAAGTPTDELRVETKLAAAAAVRSSREIISLIGEGAGATVYRSEHPFQRLQRDVETLKGHVIFDWDRAAELAGRIALGGALGPTDMA